MKKPQITLNARLMQFILIGACLLIIAVIVTTFVFYSGHLKTKAIETDHAKIDSELAQDQLVRLKQLRSTLDNNTELITKTSQIVATSQQYLYQDQVVSDLTSYANRAGVVIKGFDFESSTATATSSATSKSSSNSAAKKTLVSITLNDKVLYDSYLIFIKSIEQNVTKMQLTSISIQPNSEDFRMVDAATFDIEVYLR